MNSFRSCFSHVFLLVAVLIMKADSATYYVSPNGTNTNPGTASSPWQTIAKAASALNAGDTAIIMDGTYEEGQIVFSKDGTTAKPITVKAQNKWKAILSSRSGRDPAISAYASYITIEDLRICVSPAYAYHGPYVAVNSAINTWETSQPGLSNPSSGRRGFTARGLLIDPDTTRDTGIKTRQDSTLIENCVVHNEIEVFNNAGTIIRNNTVYKGGPNGTYILGKGGVRNMEIYNNIIHMNGGAGIILGGSTGLSWIFDPSTAYEAYNSVVYNNVVIKGGSASGIGFQMRGASNCLFANNIGIHAGVGFGNGGSGTLLSKNFNPRFINNIFVGNGTQAATTNWSGYWTGTLTVDYNDFHGFTGVPAQTHAVTGNPLFVNDTSDWHLRTGSPCIGAGTTVTMQAFGGGTISVAKDKNGILRSSPWDLGIYGGSSQSGIFQPSNQKAGTKLLMQKGLCIYDPLGRSMKQATVLVHNQSDVNQRKFGLGRSIYFIDGKMRFID